MRVEFEFQYRISSINETKAGFNGRNRRVLQCTLNKSWNLSGETSGGFKLLNEREKETNGARVFALLKVVVL